MPEETPDSTGGARRAFFISNFEPLQVSAEQYRYALQNFRIAHEQVEKQRHQLEEQERQVAILRHRISVLEGGDNQGMTRSNQRAGGQSVDDFSIKVRLYVVSDRLARLNFSASRDDPECGLET